jgi:hypothetical protein
MAQSRAEIKHAHAGPDARGVQQQPRGALDYRCLMIQPREFFCIAAAYCCVD